MKITSIIGSYRQKSNYEIIKIFENAISNFEEIESKVILLKDINLQFCRGCGLCVEDENLCPNKDDFVVLKKELIESDVLILSSPVYAYRESGLMKNFIDRFHYLHFRPQLFNKFALVAATAAKSGLYEVLRYLDFTVRGWGCESIGKLGVPMINYNSDPCYKKDIEKKIQDFAEIISNKANRKSNRTVGLLDLLIFNEQKNLISDYKKKYPKAYDFWKNNGWLDSKYYLDLEISNKIYELAKNKSLDFSKNTE